MLQIPAIKQYDDWATVYADSDSDYTFYAIPNLPRLRWFDDGTPAFTFLKFREVVQSGGADPTPGSSGGGYIQFDCELSLTKPQNDRVTSDLQDMVNQSYRNRNLTPPTVIVAPPSWHDSDKVSVMLITLPAKPDGSGFINNIATAGKPSLLGSNVATFAADLSQRGAALLWQAFQMAVMPVSVAYKLEVMAQIPSVNMHVWLHAGQLHQFTEQIDEDIDSSVWGDTDEQYTDTMSEVFAKYAVGGVEVDAFDAASSGSDDFAKLKKDLTQEGWALLEQTMQDDLKDKFAPTDAGDKGAEGDYQHTTRDYFESITQDIDISFKEKDTIPWPMYPQGSMEGILTQPGPNGHVPNKAQLFREISLDDDFFKLLQLRIHCNCDFVADPIDSVVVHVAYDTTVNDFRFAANTADQTFRAYLNKTLGKNYTYSYQVNYKNTDKVLKSGDLKGSGDQLIINVEDMGYLKFQVVPSVINWTAVDAVQVRINYADRFNGVPEQDDVLVFKDATPQTYSRLIYAPVAQPYQYAVDLFFKNEQRMTGDYVSSRGTTLLLADVFTDRLTVHVEASGGFESISSVVVDLDYQDAAHQYGNSMTVDLSSKSPYFNWTVPVWKGGPTSFRYRSVANYTDGHTAQVDWQTQTGNATVLVGEIFAGTLSVAFETDLIDWTKTRLVKLTLHYADPANHIDVSDDFVFTPAKPTAGPWKVPIKDAAKFGYDYAATFYMVDATHLTIPTTTATDPLLVLDPAASTGTNL